MFDRFTESAIKAIMLAQEEARSLGHNFVGTEQILLGLIGESAGIAAKALESLGVTLKDARIEVATLLGRGSSTVAAEVPFTPRSRRVLDLALKKSQQMGHEYVGTEHLLLGLLQDGEGVAAKVLENLGLDRGDIQDKVMAMISEKPIRLVVGRQSRKKTSTLDECGTDLTQLAAEGKLDPVVGRHTEVERVIQILGRRTKNNPILIGEPGVGKTALAEG
jgi:ATP-dependent Clp protease ATP-binding subunit ClpC